MERIYIGQDEMQPYGMLAKIEDNIDAIGRRYFTLSTVTNGDIWTAPKRRILKSVAEAMIKNGVWQKFESD